MVNKTVQVWGVNDNRFRLNFSSIIGFYFGSVQKTNAFFFFTISRQFLLWPMIYLYHVFLFWSHLNIFHVLLAAVYCIFKDIFSPTRNAVKREKEYKKKKNGGIRAGHHARFRRNQMGWFCQKWASNNFAAEKICSGPRTIPHEHGLVDSGLLLSRTYIYLMFNFVPLNTTLYIRKYYPRIV